MPSIIFVIYSGHKAREKSKLESEAKKRQKERAHRGTDRNQNSVNFGTDRISIDQNRHHKQSKDMCTQTILSLLNDEVVRNDGRSSTNSNRDRIERYQYRYKNYT